MSHDCIDPRDSNPDFEFPRFKLDEVPHPKRDGTASEFVVPVLRDGIVERKFRLDDVPHPKRE